MAEQNTQNRDDGNMTAAGNSAAGANAPLNGSSVRAAKEAGNRGQGRGRFFAAGLASGIALTLAAALVLQYMGISLVTVRSTDNSAVNSESAAKLESLEDAIDKYYYDSASVTKEQKEDGLYKGLLDSLGDPYSVYYTADEVKELNQQLSGVYYGIGAYLGVDEQTQLPLISKVMSDSPAEKAGLKDGDIIYKIDGTLTQGMSLDDVVSKVRGDKGTTVELTVVRSGEAENLNIKVTRDEVNSPTVASKIVDEDAGIGYISIAEFEDVTADQFAENLEDLYSKNIKALVLDLRGNPGGNVKTVTEIAGELIPKGLVFYMEDKNGKRTDYTSDGKHTIKIPLAVLVNGNSASASEILSGAIQDSGVGKIIGTQTYGKGIVQTVYDLHDGTAVKLTVAHYYTRSGHDINKVGITPDIKAELDEDAYRKDGTDTQLNAALKELKSEMAGEND
ncbi:MAG: S41 family peptidase [Lachnospiraceae bacterium]|nr:S41 family peptidase [Lachnospiraceae bacterium]